MEAVRSKYQLLQPLMTERLRRQLAACEAESLGRGGVSLVARATGLSRTTIWAGRGMRRRGLGELEPQDGEWAEGTGRSQVRSADFARLDGMIQEVGR